MMAQAILSVLAISCMVAAAYFGGVFAYLAALFAFVFGAAFGFDLDSWGGMDDTEQNFRAAVDDFEMFTAKGPM